MVGGMVSATLLTLVVIPAIYYLVKATMVSRDPRWSHQARPAVCGRTDARPTEKHRTKSNGRAIPPAGDLNDHTKDVDPRS